MMSTARVEPVCDRSQVPDILGDEGPSLGGGPGQEGEIGRSLPRPILPRGCDIVASFAERGRDPRRGGARRGSASSGDPCVPGQLRLPLIRGAPVGLDPLVDRTRQWVDGALSGRGSSFVAVERQVGPPGTRAARRDRGTGGPPWVVARRPRPVRAARQRQAVGDVDEVVDVVVVRPVIGTVREGRQVRPEVRRQDSRNVFTWLWSSGKKPAGWSGR